MSDKKKILKGRLAGDHLSQVASKLASVDVARAENIPCEAHVVMSSVGMESRYDESCLFPHRPYLVMNGEVRALVGDIHEGVDGLAYVAGSGPQVRFVYDFTDDELATLAAKGLFSPGFDVPSLFCDTTFELPVTVNVEVIEPACEGEAPVVFAGIARPMCIEVDAKSSGYILSDYFEAAYEGASADEFTDMAEISEAVRSAEEIKDIALDPVDVAGPELPEVPESEPVEPLYSESKSDADALSDAIFAASIASMEADDAPAIEGKPGAEEPEGAPRGDSDTSAIGEDGFHEMDEEREA